MTKDIEREAFEAWFKKTGMYTALIEYIGNHQPELKTVFVKSGKSYRNTMVNTAWLSWQAAKAHEAEKLKGFVVVPESEIQMCYLDEDEYMYIDEPDNFLCDIPIGKTVEVSRRAYMDKTSCFAAKEWDAENEDVGKWELFETKEEADKAAAHCKAMSEAARGGNE